MEAGPHPGGVREVRARATASTPPPARSSTSPCATRRRARSPAPGASSASRSPTRARTTGPDREKLATDARRGHRARPAVLDHHGARRRPRDPAAWSSAATASRSTPPRGAPSCRSTRGRSRSRRRPPDYKPKNLTLTIANKQHSDHRGRAAGARAHLPPAASVLDHQAHAWAGCSSLGGAAAAGVGTYFGVAALNDVNSSNSGCPERPAGNQRCTQAGVNSMNSASTAAWVADFTIGAGAARRGHRRLSLRDGGRGGSGGVTRRLASAAGLELDLARVGRPQLRRRCAVDYVLNRTRAR